MRQLRICHKVTLIAQDADGNPMPMSLWAMVFESMNEEKSSHHHNLLP
jgi:hypothetical protein